MRLKTEGPLQARSRDLAGKAWWAMGLLTVIVTIVSFRVQPHLWQSFTERPWGYVFPAAAVVAFFSIRLARTESRAFLCSALFLLGMLTSVAFGLFPYVLPSNTGPNLSLTIYRSGGVRTSRRPGVVDSRHGAGFSLHNFHTPEVRGKSSPERRCNRILTVPLGNPDPFGDDGSCESFKTSYVPWPEPSRCWLPLSLRC